MPVLSNSRRERFCQNLANGLTADQAYVSAGYRENRKNAARLKSNEVIGRRTAELLAARVKKNENSDITLASVLADIARACELAEARGQSNVILNAAGLRARLGGLLVEHVEIGEAGAFRDCETVDEIVDKVLEGADAHELLDGLDRLRAAIEDRLGDRAQRVRQVE